MHEHDHHHHHEHDKACTCGCHEHHHEHVHDENCTCDCHDREPDGIRIDHHEGSLIGSLSGTMEASYEEGEKILASQLRRVGERVTKSGGIIGHIKFILNHQGQSCQISVTDIDENIRRFDSGICHVEGVAIVFAIEDDVLRDILRDTLGSVLTIKK